jgi:hypothetical protein
VELAEQIEVLEEAKLRIKWLSPGAGVVNHNIFDELLCQLHQQLEFVYFALTVFGKATDALFERS